MKKHVLGKRLWLIALAPAAFLLNLAAERSPDFAEWYASTIYPVLSHIVNFVTSLAPFSVAELFIVLLIAGFIFYIVCYVIKIIKDKKNRCKNALLFVINPICFACVLYFLFVISCGINYFRYPFAQTCGLEIRSSSKAELVGLCNELADSVNALRKEVKTDSSSVMRLSDENIYITAKKAETAFDKLQSAYPLLNSGYGPPKPVISSRLMSSCNITGIFFPFTFEANVNVDVPDYTIPLTMGHELSHLRGYMREDEANFIGYIMCEKSGDPEFEYSGKMLAFIYSYNALFSTDHTEAQKVFSKLGDGVKLDLSNNAAYWEQFQGPVAKAAEAVNDSYLKANKQEDGVKSYGRMVDLLLAEYRTKKEAR